MSRPNLTHRCARRLALVTLVLVLLGAVLTMAVYPAIAVDLTREGRLGRWTASGYGEGYAVFAVDPDTQDQDPAGIFGLTLTGDVHQRARIFFDVRAMVGGWARNTDGADLFNLDDTFQSFNPSFEVDELYLDLYLGKVDVRVGKQKFAWGNLDTFNPTDVLNTRWWNDPFITEVEDRKIGVPALSASYFLPELGPRLPQDTSLTFIWVPVPVSVRFPDRKERWFPESTNVQSANAFPPNSVDIGGGTTLPNAVDVTNELRTKNDSPPRNMSDGAFAARLRGFYGSVDWSLYGYSGQETAPAFDFSASVIWPGAPILPPSNQPVVLQASSLLEPRFDRIGLLGADASTSFGGLTARAEAAFGWDRLQPRTTAALLSEENLNAAVSPRQIQRLFQGKPINPDLGNLFVSRDTIEWGLGADYMYRGWLPLVQVNQTVVLDNDIELLLADVDTQFLFALRKSFFAERLDMDLSVIQGVARGYTSALADFTVEITDHFRVRLGYLLIAGSRRTLIGQFHDNDQGFLQVRYSF
jgi:hypothetical protein